MTRHYTVTADHSVELGAGASNIAGDTGPKALATLDAGCAAQSVKKVSSPDYKIVRYIHDFNLFRCSVSLTKVLAPKPNATCGLIKLTHNPVPDKKAASTPGRWADFVADQEYRGFVHLPSYQIQCSAGRLTAAPFTHLSEPEVSSGFTPIGVGDLKFFKAGDPYLDQGGAWNDPDPKLTVEDGGRSLKIVYKTAVRANNLESLGNVLLTWRSLPFVWTVLEEKISCSQGVDATVFYSGIPSITVFKDGGRFFKDTQTNDWGPFMLDGGLNFSAGHGNLTRRCSARQLAPESLRAPAPCQDIIAGTEPS